MRAAAMTIGMLAKEAVVSVETIRYYQRIELLPTPARGYGSVRRYDVASIERLRFIKRGQQLGFSLKEVAFLLRLEDGNQCDEARALAAHKLVAVDKKLADLHAMREVLAKIFTACTSNDGAKQSCPLIASLTEISAPARR